MLIDDSDKHVRYTLRDQWKDDVLAEAVQGTRHGAALPGLTVSVDFHGTSIQVVGILDGKGGQPTIDCMLMPFTPCGTYTAPIPDGNPDTRKYNVTFFDLKGLRDVPHTLTLTNTNGTSPNIFWLDYFLVDENVEPSSSTGSDSVSGSAVETSSASPLPSNSTLSVQSSSSSAISSPTIASPNTITSTPDTTPEASPSVVRSGPPGVDTSGPSPELPSTSASMPPQQSLPASGTESSGLSQNEHSGTNTAAIVGGVLGVLLVLALVAIAVLIRKRRSGSKNMVFPDDDRDVWRGDTSELPWVEEMTSAPKDHASESLHGPLPLAYAHESASSLVPDLPPSQRYRQGYFATSDNSG
ncbi:hypothetical protein C8Q76DRAFT_804096 [Earliella scabrosa]|nr:hypothetical protein C8Q76DRAFT_804096 [Earliella scabrosa]